jgi:Uma2 family endonuclease
MHEARKLEHYTYDEYLQIDRDTQERVELIFGDIYLMAGASAEHQDVVLNLAYVFKSISRDSHKCTPRIAPYDIKLDIDGDRSVVQPDVMLFCGDDALPCAIFEVLSPSTAYKDMTVKKELYERAGVREYFLVNIEHKVVEKFRLDGERYAYDKTYGAQEQMSVACMQTEIGVDAIFEEIKGES